RVLAYSTISQLGYMFLGCGVGAFASGIFHLMTHAFFKALLFLGAGSVIHALSGEQDLWKMGGLKSHLPKTHLTFLIATLAIAGVFPFAGFFSKDEILYQTWLRGGPVLWCAGIIGAFLTAFYMFRLYFLTFHGPSRAPEDVKRHIHESPNSMTVPLMLLAALSAIGGFIQVPLIEGGQRLEAFLDPVFADAAALVPPAHAAAPEGAEVLLMLISLAVALVGIFVAYRFYLADPGIPRRLAEQARGLYRLVFNKYWVDEAYESLVVQPIYRGSVSLWQKFDAAVIDGAVNGVGRQIERAAGLLREAQVGYVQVYALILTLGTVVVIGYLALR
ncbi:MAG TPA: proton-conducting transporter membrane subunit, partial [Candidatus Eisenbacteria bacterium]|nr:proton-conducting transporter membrane subunit [Candidatus Eisenbacteria bacterium]